MFLGHNGSSRSENAVRFRKEPSPGGRGGKMLEETLLITLLMSGLPRNLAPRVAGLSRLCDQSWESPRALGSRLLSVDR
jgi:hypothetical protein